MRRKREEIKERRTLETCYVCGNKITGQPIDIGGELHRHIRCEPGSARWMKSDRAKVSELTQFFQKGDQHNGDRGKDRGKNPDHQAGH